MIKQVSNPTAAAVDAVRAHVSLRVTLLASCARDIKRSDNTVTAWARAELVAVRDGLTDIDAIQDAACEKFPKLTANGKVSKTPNSSFKTSFDKVAMLAAIISGDSKTYATDSARSLVDAFLADGSKLTLNDCVDRIKGDKAATARELAANETEGEKEARKAKEAARVTETLAGTVVNDGAVMLALAKRIDALDGETASAFEAPLSELMLAAERAIGRAIDHQRANAAPELIAKAA